MSERSFIIYTADRKNVAIEASSISRAVLKSGLNEEDVICVVDAVCVPRMTATEAPFFAVLMRNPNFGLPTADEG